MDHGEGHLAETCCHQRKDGYFPSAHLPPQQVDESDGQLCKTTTGFRSSQQSEPEHKTISLGTIVRDVAKATAIAALVLAASLNANPALAAGSGGRMGGSSFSAAQSYGGSSSSGMSRSFGGNYGSSMRSQAPAVGGSTSYSFGWGLVPFGGYGYGGYGGQVGGYGGGGGGGIGSLLLYGFIAAVAFTALSGFFKNNEGDVYDDSVTVTKLQVGLLGDARRLQKQLDRIAGRADTNTPSGLHYILQETVLQLIRTPEYVQYGATTTSRQRDLDRGEKKFNEISLEERSKFKEETLVNVGGRTRRQRYSQGPSGNIQEYIVITILVAAQGKVELPKINNQETLVKALNKLAALRQEDVMAVEVLWTPEDEEDAYSRDEMLMDYPSLNNV
ncbi:g4966 [Coccomyxa viridis]|uniref:G4966 protein n=1 Tax=Coccomyxa viridis TaxID=1274662 RepID=A0ABP1FRL4_9CHLO